MGLAKKCILITKFSVDLLKKIELNGINDEKKCSSLLSD